MRADYAYARLAHWLFRLQFDDCFGQSQKQGVSGARKWWNHG